MTTNQFTRFKRQADIMLVSIALGVFVV